jgi:transcriptional regulator with XRE-family HTH domain
MRTAWPGVERRARLDPRIEAQTTEVAMIALAETLREARQNAGLTQRQVADALAVPHTYPSRWERGVTRPGPANLLALAELYSLDAADLLRMYAGVPAERQVPARTPRSGGKAGADAAAALSAAVADAASEANPPRRRRRASARGGAAAGG